MNGGLIWPRPRPYSFRVAYQAGDYGKLSKRDASDAGLLTGYYPGAAARQRLKATLHV